jgi:hypothetical protein
MLGKKRGCCSEWTRLRFLSRKQETSIHFVCPVVNRLFVVYLLPKPSDERTRCPNVPRLFLFSKHGIKYRHEPVLELAVVVIGYNKISNAIHPPFS